MFPKTSKTENKNDATKALAALVYFKMCREFMGMATQFEAVAAFGINQRRLSEVLHGQKYLGGKQKVNVKGTEEDLLQVASEGNEEEEENEEKKKQNPKRKITDDDEEDDPEGENQPKSFTMKPPT